jgi:thioredoxin-like negative regulator of GroEL
MSKTLTFGEVIGCESPTVLVFYDKSKKNEEITVTDGLTKLTILYGGEISAIKLDINDNKSLSDTLRVESTPLTYIYQNGRAMYRTKGFNQHYSMIVKLIARYLKNIIGDKASG